MLVLAVESATEAAGVALADEAGVLSSATTSRGRRHAESVAPSVDFVCRRAGVSLRDVEGICVDVGPGLFTGLRVGISTAKALGFALGVPVASATSLEVLAEALSAWGADPGSLLVPVVDAKRAEVFSARFRSIATSGGPRSTIGAVHGGPLQIGPVQVGPVQVGEVQVGAVQVGEDVLSSPEALARSLSDAGERIVLAGDGALRYGHLLGAVRGATLAQGAPASPPVEVLARMGVVRLAAGLGIDSSQILPRYLREADARINWEQRLMPQRASRAGS